MLKRFYVRESVEKEVVKFGNGSIVYTPKKWIGRTVTVILEEKPADIAGEAMEALKTYLDRIEGIYLFGSFARNEASPGSDIDLLVISTQKINLKKLGRIEFLARTKQEFLNGLKEDRTLFLHQLLGEAKPVLNEALLGELRKSKIRPSYGEFLEDTLAAFKSVHDLLGAARKQGLEHLDSFATIYSLVLRFRGLVSAQCLAKNKAYSGKKLASALASHGFGQETINDFLAVYRAERDGKKTAVRVRLADAERLFEAAKKEFVKTELAVKA